MSCSCRRRGEGWARINTRTLSNEHGYFYNVQNPPIEPSWRRSFPTSIYLGMPNKRVHIDYRPMTAQTKSHQAETYMQQEGFF